MKLTASHDFVAATGAPNLCSVCAYPASHTVHFTRDQLDVDRVEASITSRDALVEKYKKAAVMPAHYKRFEIEPLHFSVVNKLNPFQMNIIKYVCRAEFKNGVEDLHKAKRTVEMYIKYLEGDPNWMKAPDEEKE